MQTITASTPSATRPDVRRCYADLDDPARVPRAEAEQIAAAGRPGFWFVHPLAVVSSPDESDEAFQLCERFHVNWYRLLQRRWKTTWRTVRRQIDDRLLLSYTFDGVVVIRHTIIPYTWWRDCWNVGIDAGRVFSQRPDAIDLLGAGDTKALEELQHAEVQRLQHDGADRRIHVVFPHLTISMPSNAFLNVRVDRERDAWKRRFRNALGKEEAATSPPSIRLGQLITGNAATTLDQSNLRDALADVR